jgi:phage terminase large subunit
VRVSLPDWAECLFQPSRYKAAYGGRGSAKSHSFATALVIQSAQQPLRILCAREIQKSIKDSVKRLIDDKINECGLGGNFESTDTEIRGKNGSLFLFAGLRTNPDSIKSMEGLDRVWVEEANRVSRRSLDLLIPTLRKDGSELWFSWNPELETDPVDAMFRGGEAPPDSIIRQVNYTDNPWFPEVLRAELEYDRGRDPDKYAHVWLGKYSRRSESRVFRNWKVEEFDTPADAVFRFGADWGFSVDPTVLVRCFVDGRKLYVDQEAWEVGCEIDETPYLFAGDEKPANWPKLEPYLNRNERPGIEGASKWKIVADSARPETVSYMQRRGFKIVPAIKGPGSLEDGVEFLKSYDIIVHPRCVHVADELTFYSYKTDPLTEEILPVLDDKKNHTIDALRYALEALRRVRPTEAPPKPKVRDMWAPVQSAEHDWKVA